MKESSVLLFGDVAVDLERRVIDGDPPIQLTETETKLLTFLWRNTGHFVSRDELLVGVWGWKSGMTSRAVVTMVHRLRMKLEVTPKNPHYIVSQYGRGYQLANVERQPEEVDICCWMRPSQADGVSGGFKQWFGAGPVIVGRSRSYETLLARTQTRPRLAMRLDSIRRKLGGGTPRVASLASLGPLSRITAGIDVAEHRLRVLAFPSQALPIYWRSLGAGAEPERLHSDALVETSRAINLIFGDAAAPSAQLFVFANQRALTELGDLACELAINPDSATTYGQISVRNLLDTDD